MAQTKRRKSTEVQLVDIKRHKGQLTLPDKMTYGDAIKVLRRQQEYEEEFIKVNLKINAFPWDGALALFKAMEEQYGWPSHDTVKVRTMFGVRREPPEMLSIEIGPNETKNIPWGQFSLPGLHEESYIRTGATRQRGLVIFAVEAYVQRKDEGAIIALVDAAREICKRESIYRGKAIRLNLRDESGRRIDMPEPKFMVLGKTPPTVIFTEELERMIETNVLAPIEHAASCRKAGVPLKRGVLLAGPYGTGKTLLATQVAHRAVANEWTYIYLEHVNELADALRFAQQYAPAVIFAEDVDRAVSGGRTTDLDSILNTLDGIDTKAGEVMTVLTTNHLEEINRAMLRPGRLDFVVHIDPPNAEAAERLVRHYAGNLLPADTDISAASNILDGQIPAVIREAVERAKLGAIQRTGKPDILNGDDLEVSAMSMARQQALVLDKGGKDERHLLERTAEAIGEGIVSAAATVMAEATGRPLLASDE